MRQSIVLALAAMLAAGSASAQQVTVGAGSSLTISDASIDLGCSDLIVSGTMNLDGTGDIQTADLSLAGAGSIANSGQIDIAGDWDANGTFDFLQVGQVRFVDGCGLTTSTILGSTTFNDLTLVTTTGKQVRFEQGQTTTVDGSFSAQGASGNLLQIRSTSNGSEAFLELILGGIGDFVDVEDNHAVDQPVLLGENSTLGDNADGWTLLSSVPGLSLLGLATLVGAILFKGRRGLERDSQSRP